MNITLIGSLGHINAVTVPALVQAGHDVTVITSSDKRVAAIKALGAHAAVGSIRDVDFLATSMTGTDRVYLMLTGMMATDDPVQLGGAQGMLYRLALTAAGVKEAVVLSSVGADQGPEVGSLYAYHLMEDALRQTPGTQFTFLRPVGFFSNLLANAASLKQQHAIVNNYGPEIASAYTDPRDIAQVALAALTATPFVPGVRYVVSQWLTGNELVAQLRTGLKLPDLQWVTIPDDAMVQQLEAHGVPAAVATPLMQMRAAQRTQAFYADLRAHESALGQARLIDWLPALQSAMDQVKE